MASWNSKQYAQTSASPVQHIDPREHGRVRAVIFTWPQPGDTTSTPAAADTINLCWLPPGAQVVGGRVHFEANAGSSTLSIGTVASPTLYLNAQAISSASAAGGVALIPAGGGTMAAPIFANQEGNTLNVNALNTGAATLIIGTVGGATLTAGKRIAGMFEYIMD